MSALVHAGARPPTRWAIAGRFLAVHRSLAAMLSAVVALLMPVAPVLAWVAPDRVKVSFIADRDSVRPGDQLAVAVVFDIAEHWHIQPNQPKVPPELKGFEPIPTTIDVGAIVVGARPGPVQWPKPVTLKTKAFGPELELEFLAGKAVAFVPVIVADDAKGELTIALTAGYQACDDQVCMMQVDAEGSITLPIRAEAGSTANADVFAPFDRSVFADMLSGHAATPTSGKIAPAAPKPLVISTFGLDLRLDPRSGPGFVGLVLLAFLGGFVLNLTPCVLPVIPLKVMGLSRAGGTRARTLLLGAVMSSGVVAFWLAIGVLIAGVKAIGAVSEIFANPYFGLGIGAFIALMALGMMGLFTIQLPGAVQGYTPKQESVAGSFSFGVMTAVLGTPCFGPFAGAAAGWAATAPIALALTVFGVVGLGMASPYLVLAAKPGLVKKLPKAGPASELVKQVMGLLLLASAAYFVGASLLGLVAEKPYLAGVIHWWFAALFAAAAGGWLLMRTVQITPSIGRRAFFGLLGLVIAGGGAAWAVYQTRVAADTTPAAEAAAAKEGVWSAYTQEAFDAAKSAGKVVVIDFTAAWCLNCKALEAAVLNQPAVQSALKSDGVVALKADLTSRKAPGWKALRDFDEVGIPLLVIVGPGLRDPYKSNAYTVDAVLQAIERARPTPRGGPN